MSTGTVTASPSIRSTMLARPSVLNESSLSVAVGCTTVLPGACSGGDVAGGSDTHSSPVYVVSGTSKPNAAPCQARQHHDASACIPSVPVSGSSGGQMHSPVTELHRAPSSWLWHLHVSHVVPPQWPGQSHTNSSVPASHLHVPCAQVGQALATQMPSPFSA